MRKIVFGLFLTLVFSLSVVQVQAQSSKQEKEFIKQTIEMYFDGWMTGDTLKLGKAMHSTCHLKFIRDGEMGIRNRERYLSGFKPRPRLEGASGRILKINRTGNIASAKCELEIPGRLFTDYFNMMKLDNRWYIVDKISTNVKLKKKREKKKE